MEEPELLIEDIPSLRTLRTAHLCERSGLGTDLLLVIVTWHLRTTMNRCVAFLD